MHVGATCRSDNGDDMRPSVTDQGSTYVHLLHVHRTVVVLAQPCSLVSGFQPLLEDDGLADIN